MKIIRFLLLALFVTMSTSVILAQAPQGVNYQAVARDGAGVPLINTAVNVLYQIRQSTPAGTVVYSETHATTTNQFGLFTLEIGSGTPVIGTFPGINWSAGLYYLQVTVNGDVMAPSQLLSVPYALHANTAASGSPGANGHAALADSVAEAPGANCPNGGYLIHMGADDNDDGTLQPLERDISYYICNGLDGSANNNDTSATNELQTLSISNDTIFLTNGGFVVLPNSAGDGDWQVTGNDMSSLPTGNVGVGTTTPTRKLEVETASTAGDGILIDNSSTGNPGLMFSTQGTPRFVMGVHQSDGDKFKIGTTNVFTNTRFTIDQQGNVGIGTVGPVHRLTVASADTVIASFSGSNPNGSLISIASFSPTAPVGAVFLTGVDSAVLGLDPTDKTFYLANTTQDGHVGVFADSSVALYGQVVANIANTVVNSADTIINIPNVGNNIIHINQGTYLTDSLYVLGQNAANPGYVLTNDGFGQAQWQAPSGGGLWLSNSPDIYFNTGNVGIGVGASMAARLDVNGNAKLNGGQLYLGPVGGVNNGYTGVYEDAGDLKLAVFLPSNTTNFGTNSLDAVTIKANSGNVGIGTTAPSSELDVAGIITTDSLIMLSGAGVPGNVLTDDGTGNAVWAAAPGTVNSRIQDIDNNTWIETDILGTGLEDKIRFSLNGTERLIIDNNGLLGIGTAFPSAPLHVANGALGAAGSAVLMSNNTNPTNASSLGLYKSRGSEAAPAPIQQNDVIGSLEFNAYNSVSYDKAAGILVAADESFASTSMGSHMEFHIAPISMGPAQEAMRLSNQGWLGLGTTNPLVQFHVADETQTTAAIQASHNGPADQAGNFTMVRSRGSIAAPAAVQLGDRLGKLEWVGWNSGTGMFEEKASIRVSADEAYTGGSTASHMEFHVTPFGQTTSIEAMMISEAGNLGIGTGAPVQKLHIQNGTIRIDDGLNPYDLPAQDGAPGQVLTTDGIGTVTWQPGGGSSPWVKTGPNIYQAALTDFVGIGTSVPASPLEVNHAGNSGFGQIIDYSFTGAAGNAIGLYVGSQGNNTGGVVKSAQFDLLAAPSAVESDGIEVINTASATTNFGVKVSTGGAGTTNYGIYSEVSGATTNWSAFFANGDVFVGAGLVIPTNAGQGKILTSDAAGNATWKENQVAFHIGGGNGSNSSTQNLSASTPEIIQFINHSHFYNPTGAFNIATGIFTAPVPGMYSFTATVTMGGPTNQHFDIDLMHSSGQSIAQTGGFIGSEQISQVSRTVTGIVHLNAGEQVWVEYFSAFAVGSLFGERSAFNGHLIYAD